MSITHKNNHLYTCGLTTLALALCVPAQGYSTELEEIVITAQKREQSLQEVGITVTAFGANALKDRGLTDLDTLADAVPNLQSQDKLAGQSHFRIRGIGLNEFQVSFDAPVGINLDEFILSKPFMGSMGFFDIGRVEVLKGPQGTVFGRNTTGGAVNYYTNKPTEELEAGIRATYANFKRVEFDAYLSGQLAEGLTGRISTRYINQSDGAYLNLFNNEKIGGKTDNFQVRGQLQWKNDTTKILASGHFGKVKGETKPYDNLFQDIPGGAQAGGTTDVNKVIRNPLGRFVVNQDYFPTQDNTSRGFNLRIDHDTSFGTISSLTSYEYFERDQREDSDNTPVVSVNIDWYSKIDQFTQELRLAGEQDNWNYLIGAYYENDDLLSVDTIDVTAVRLGDEFTQVTDSYALFTNHEFALNDQMSITAGARYTSEKTKLKSRSYVALGAAGPDPENRVDPATDLAAFLSDVERTDNKFDFKIGVNYKPSEDVLLFASYSTGFRSGGFDVGFNAPLETFDPENVKAIEAGVKSTLMDGSMNLNVSIFQTDVNDYQENANLPTELVPRRRNIGKLRSKGIEADLNWQLTDQFKLTTAVGYTDSKIIKSDFLIGTIPVVGNRPANSPEFSSNIFATYVQPINDDYEVEIMGGWTHVGSRFMEIENQADHLVGSYDTFNGRIIFSPSDRSWQFSIWGKNLTNEVHVVYVNDVPGFGLFLPINNDPRTYGATFEINF